MTTPLRRLLAATLVPTAALAVLAGPAHAARDVAVDPRGDVDTLSAGKAAPAAGAAARADVVRFVTRHTAKRVELTVTTRASLGNDFDVSMPIRTPGGSFVANYNVLGGQENATVFVPDEGTVRCDGLRVTGEPAKAAITVSVPRNCLGQPRWVRTGAEVSVFAARGTVKADDARRTGNATAPTKLGPRVARG